MIPQKINLVKLHKLAAQELLEQGYPNLVYKHENLAFKYAIEALKQGYTKEDFLKYSVVCPFINI